MLNLTKPISLNSVLDNPVAMPYTLTSSFTDPVPLSINMPVSKVPTAADINAPSLASTLLKIDTPIIVSTTDSTVQTTTTNANNAFKWVERVITPDMFATPDSVIIGWSDPIKGSGSAGAEIPVIGMCDSLSINTGVNVVTLKELRNERTIIIPCKSSPGSISISRMLGIGPNFARIVSNGKSDWRMDTHSIDYKQLFGLVIIFMSPTRANTLCSLYAERCAIQSASLTVQTGQTSVFEGISIVFDRLIDNAEQITWKDTPVSTPVASTVKSAVPTTGLTFASTSAVVNTPGTKVASKTSYASVKDAIKTVNKAQAFIKAIRKL